MANWEQGLAAPDHRLLKGDGFMISYRAEVEDGDTEEGETALLIDGEYWILNGDWRDLYDAALADGGLERCKELFQLNREQYESRWSTAP